MHKLIVVCLNFKYRLTWLMQPEKGCSVKTVEILGANRDR